MVSFVKAFVWLDAHYFGGCLNRNMSATAIEIPIYAFLAYLPCLV